MPTAAEANIGVKTEVVPRAHDDDAVLVRVDDLDERVRRPARPEHDERRAVVVVTSRADVLRVAFRQAREMQRRVFQRVQRAVDERRGREEARLVGQRRRGHERRGGVEGRQQQQKHLW